jgi:hypothetical protein
MSLNVPSRDALANQNEKLMFGRPWLGIFLGSNSQSELVGPSKRDGECGDVVETKWFASMLVLSGRGKLVSHLCAGVKLSITLIGLGGEAIESCGVAFTIFERLQLRFGLIVCREVIDPLSILRLGCGDRMAGRECSRGMDANRSLSDHDNS